MTKHGAKRPFGSQVKMTQPSQNHTPSTNSAQSSASIPQQSLTSFEEGDSSPQPESESSETTAQEPNVLAVPAFDADLVVRVARDYGRVISLPDPSKTIEEQDEDVLLAMCIHGEARGEPLVGMAAVAQVVVNRKNDPTQRSYLGCKKGGTRIRDVILFPKAFSCFNANDPNREKLLRPNKSRWVDCAIAAAAILSGKLPDSTDGSTHYHTIRKPGFATVWPPKWASHPKMVRTVSICRHIFYREEP